MIKLATLNLLNKLFNDSLIKTITCLVPAQMGILNKLLE